MADSLLVAWLPQFELATCQALVLCAAPERVYAAARARPLMHTPPARFLLRVRALPALLDPHGSPEGSGSLLLLAEDAPRALVFGFCGPFWHPSRNIAPIADPAAWRAFARDGMAKAAVAITVEALPGGATRLATETRVVCYGAAARRRFRLYWSWAGLGSGLIRRVWLEAVRQDLRKM